MSREIIQPNSVHSTAGVGYSHAARAGDMIFLAGQISLDRDGNLVGVGDIEAQATQVYRNIEAILSELGASFADIVKTTTFLTRREDLEGFRRARDRVFSDPFPPNTLLFVSSLAHPDYMIEIEVIAHIGQDKR